jgi:hypothetical protein
MMRRIEIIAIILLLTMMLGCGGGGGGSNSSSASIPNATSGTWDAAKWDDPSTTWGQ